MNYEITELLKNDGFTCECGKKHFAKVKDVVIEEGAIKKIPSLVRKYGAGRVFIFADENTYKAAGEQVEAVLGDSGIAFSHYIFPGKRFEPDEKIMGSAILHFDPSCDMLITVGTGSLNDTGKIVANLANKPYMIVGTAPSMDGFASATSSMIIDNLKISVNSKCPEVVVGDIDILKNAPLKMIQAGLGDILAKYVSIAEWKLANIVNGEYYCPLVADIINAVLKKCVDNAAGITERRPEAVKAVMEAMVLSGIAANYAGISNPVSGTEHYFSHIWDMRALEFGTPFDLHGIQCGIGTLLTLRVYDYLKTLTPDKEKALSAVSAFDYEKHCEFLKANLGKSADAMIEKEKSEGKYLAENHRRRLEALLANYDEVIKITNELPSYADVEAILDLCGAPKSPAQLGITEEETKNAFIMTKDIRAKYVVSRFLWDIGEEEKTVADLF